MDPKIVSIRGRILKEEPIVQYYKVHDNLLFIKNNPNIGEWKLVIPSIVEEQLILDYHIRYGHMGAMKVVKALEEQVYIKSIYRKVSKTIQKCHICQMVKCNNSKKEGMMIPIISSQKLERVFLDICGPFPRSGGRHRFKFIIIIFDHFTKYTKLYSINRATTKKIIEIILTKFIPEVGKPMAIITDHGTQFKGTQWKSKLWEHGIKTYKTSVYHPSSNPAERVLREVGRILRTYCHNKQKEWHNYLRSTEEFINLAYHLSLIHI